MDHVLRAANEKAQAFSSAEIAYRGFGHSQMLYRAPGGVLVSEHQKRVYRMSCNCLISDTRECGAPCPFCLVDRAALWQIDLTLPIPEELVWLSVPCRNCFAACEWPPRCEYRGGCHDHVLISASDGKRYCRVHYPLVEDQARLQAISDKYGWLAKQGFRLTRSLFLDSIFGEFRWDRDR